MTSATLSWAAAALAPARIAQATTKARTSISASPGLPRQRCDGGRRPSCRKPPPSGLAHAAGRAVDVAGGEARVGGGELDIDRGELDRLPRPAEDGLAPELLVLLLGGAAADLQGRPDRPGGDAVD